MVRVLEWVTLILMKYLKNRYLKIKDFFKRRPKVIIPVVAILSLFIFAGIECVRASAYLNSVDSYKNSVEILNAKDTVEKLQTAVKLSSKAYFCDVSHDDLLPAFNEAYADFFTENNHPEALIPKLNSQLEIAGSPPSFSSLMKFLPKPRQAELASREIKTAYTNLIELTKENEINKYCINLETALVRTYFLQDLKKPEGVSALLPGQIDNFQANVSQSQDLIKNMTFPSQFEQEHLKVLEFLNKVAGDLNKDDNNYKQFARDIEADLIILDEALASIRAKTTELQKIPDDIALQASILE